MSKLRLLTEELNLVVYVYGFIDVYVYNYMTEELNLVVYVYGFIDVYAYNYMGTLMMLGNAYMLLEF